MLQQLQVSYSRTFHLTQYNSMIWRMVTLVLGNFDDQHLHQVQCK